MAYRVTIKKKVSKGIKKLPVDIRNRLTALIMELTEDGPVRANWPNYSKLSSTEFHCHLAYKWVACWKWIENTIEIEVYYAGSRENAPY